MAKSKPYNEKNDKPQDKKFKKGMSPDEKNKYEKMDKAHGAKKKPKTMKEDDKADAKIRKSILEKRHEKKESKSQEKKEHKGKEKKEKK